VTVAVGHAAVIVVDVQNDFVHPDGKVGREGHDMAPLSDAIRAINRLVERAREASVPVVYVRVTHSPSVDNAAYRARYATRGMAVDDLLCAEGSWGADFHPDLAVPASGDLIVTKHAYNGFAVAELPAHLETLDVDTVIVTGVVTELCVMGTVAGAFENGYHVVVPREAAGSVDAAAADAALKLIAGFYGIVASVEDVMVALDASARVAVEATPTP
jgi:ureidoacrylate peracid hydrolase